MNFKLFCLKKAEIINQFEICKLVRLLDSIFEELGANKQYIPNCKLSDFVYEDGKLKVADFDRVVAYKEQLVNVVDSKLIDNAKQLQKFFDQWYEAINVPESDRVSITSNMFKDDKGYNEFDSDLDISYIYPEPFERKRQNWDYLVQIPVEESDIGETNALNMSCQYKKLLIFRSVIRPLLSCWGEIVIKQQVSVTEDLYKLYKPMKQTSEMKKCLKGLDNYVNMLDFRLYQYDRQVYGFYYDLFMKFEHRLLWSEGRRCATNLISEFNLVSFCASKNQLSIIRQISMALGSVFSNKRYIELKYFREKVTLFDLGKELVKRANCLSQEHKKPVATFSTNEDKTPLILVNY